MRHAKWFAFTVGGILALSLSGFGQEQGPSRGQSKASAGAAGSAASSSQADASAGNRTADVRAGQKIDAQLVSTVDARTAKLGQEVVARVTKDVKQNGRVVVHKGDRLVGHVTDVQAAATSKSESHLGIVFNQLVTGESTASLNAVVVSMLSVQQRSNSQAEAMAMPEPMPVIMPPGGVGRATGGGGGLIGGAAAATGSVAGTAGTAVGGAAGSTLGQVGATAGAATRGSVASASQAGLATPISAIRLHSEVSGQQQTGTTSVLSTRHGNLRLDSGTEMKFQVAGGAEAK